mmetsp:Transcript_117889/g.327760  ORF Transcript_117889/g.327760 Transcript_117889/m.327760 type:complete len:219 (+) Transcript_117889:221-877(+)
MLRDGGRHPLAAALAPASRGSGRRQRQRFLDQGVQRLGCALEVDVLGAPGAGGPAAGRVGGAALQVHADGAGRGQDDRMPHPAPRGHVIPDGGPLAALGPARAQVDRRPARSPRAVVGVDRAVAQQDAGGVEGPQPELGLAGRAGGAGDGAADRAGRRDGRGEAARPQDLVGGLTPRAAHGSRAAGASFCERRGAARGAPRPSTLGAGDGVSRRCVSA